MRRLKWAVPAALLITLSVAPAALGIDPTAAALPGFSRHTAIDAVLNGTATIDSTDATGTLSKTCVGQSSPISASHVVWFRWKAAVNGTMEANTTNSGYDTVLYLFQSGKFIDCDDDTASLGAYCPNVAHCSQIFFDATAGRTYYFGVGGYNSTDFGDTHLTLID